MLVVANYGNSTAFLEILLGKDATELATLKIKKGTKEDAKVKDFAKLYQSNLSDMYVLLPLRKVNNLISLEIAENLLTKHITPSTIVCLETLYKTMINFQSFDSLPLGLLQSSSAAPFKSDLINSKDL